MSCRDIERDIPLFVGDDLPPARATVIRQHAATCASCRKQVQDHRAARSWITDLPTWQPSSRTLDDMRRSLRLRLEEDRHRPWFTRWSERAVDALRRWSAHPGLAGAAALVLVLGVVGSLHLAPQGRPAARLEVPAVSQQAAPAPIESATEAEPSTNDPSPGDEELAANAGELQDAPDQTVLHIQTKDPDVRIIWLMAKGPEN